MTHLPLNPVERFMLLKRQDCEAVTALPDWSVWNFRSRENATPHHVGCPADIRRSAASVGEHELAAELDSFPLLEQLSANPWPVLDQPPAALRLRRCDAISGAEATIDQCSITIEVDPVPSESKRLAPPNTGEEIERDESTLPALGRRNDLIRVIRHHVRIFGFVGEVEVLVLCLPRILEWLHPEQKVFVEQFSDASEVQDLAEDIPRH